MPYIYRRFKEQILTPGQWSTPASGYKAVLATGAPAETAADPNYDDIEGGGATIMDDGGAELKPTITPNFTNGVMKDTNTSITFANADSAGSYTSLIVYADSGTPGTSRLMAMIDGFTGITTNGGNVIVNWDTSTNMNGIVGGIFAL